MSSQADEINIPGLHAQILANLRITDPDIVQPVITTGCNNEGTCAVTALRGLLKHTSYDIYKKWLEDDSE
ncbi:hypothetical protein KCU67_g12953, partial [Aureobasidium melanogenum]